MAFLNVVFPQLKLLHGVSKSRSNTTVVFGNSRKEYRIRRCSLDPLTWSWPDRNLTVADARTLVAFYNSVQGSLYSFKYQDPDDYKWSDFALQYHSGTKWRVVSNSGSPIYNANGNIAVKLGGVSQGNKTISFIDDVPVIDVPGSISSSSVTINGQFYYNVRFSSDLNYQIGAMDINNDTSIASISSFSLREVAEHA